MSAIDHKTCPISINLSFRVWKKLILPIDVIDVFEPNVGRLLLKNMTKQVNYVAYSMIKTWKLNLKKLYRLNSSGAITGTYKVVNFHVKGASEIIKKVMLYFPCIKFCI